jgi:beta-galactosidase beta subunit
MITEQCLVGCTNHRHHYKCDTNVVNYEIQNDKDYVICSDSYANLTTAYKTYIIIFENDWHYTIRCDNGIEKPISKRLFFKKNQ